jgi:hypothetical protein
MNLIKKLFVYTMVFTMCMAIAPIGSISADSVEVGLIKSPASSAVYYFDGGERYAFPHQSVFFSWYEDFDAVVTITADELAAITYNGKLITMRAGTHPVKIESDPKVYAVEPGGVLRHIADEDTALALYGADWASMIVDVSDAFWFWYDKTDAVDNKLTADAHAAGTVFSYTDSELIYYVDADGTKRLVDEAGFTANMFNADYVVTGIADTITYTTGTSVTAAEDDLFPIVSGTIVTPPAPVGGDLSIALAAGTPVAGTIPAGSPNVFTVFNFTTGSEAASISSIKLTMPSGILGTSTYLDSITFFDNGIKLGSSKNMNSSREATFNFSTPIEVVANTTKTLTVKATVESAQTGRFALGIDSADDITVDGGSITGTFPVVGNQMTAVADASIGTVALSAVNGTAAAGTEFGEQNVQLAGFTLSSTNEAVIWETARFKNGGTNDAALVNNLRLLIDGDEVAVGTVDGRYMNFPLNNYVVTKGDSVSVEVYGDIGVGSVGNTIKLYIEDKSDFSFVGQQYGYGIAITSIILLDTASEGIVVTLATGDFTIAMDKTASPVRDIVAGADDEVLAVIKMTSNGEDATIASIKENGSDEFVVSGTGIVCNELENVELKDLTNSAIYDVTIATSTGTATKCGLTITEEMTLLQGETHTFELRADVGGTNDTNSADSGDTYQVTLEDGAFDITGDTSNDAITDITPTSVTGSIITVRGGALSWSTVALNNATIVGGAGSTGDPVVVYKAWLEVGDAIDLKLQSVKINTQGADAAFSDNNIAQLDLYIIEDGVSRLVKSTAGSIVETAAAADAYINFTTLDSTNRVLTAGKDVYLELRAIFTNAVPDTGAFDLELGHATDYVVVQDKDNLAVVETIADATQVCRIITVAAKGTLKAALLTTDNKANDDMYILAGTESVHGRYLGELEFTTANEAIKITNLALEEYGDATGADIRLVKLYDKDGNLVAYKAPTALGHVHFEDTDFMNGKEVLPADQVTSYFIGVDIKGMNVDGDPESTTTFDHGIQYSFASTTAVITTLFGLSVDEAVKAEGYDSGEAITIVEQTAATLATSEYSLASEKTKTASTTGSILTSVTNAMEDGTLTAGSGKIVGKYTFVFDNADNRASTNEELKAQLVTLVLNVTTSTEVVATNFLAYVEGNSSDTATGTFDTATGIVTFALESGFGADTEMVDGEVTLYITADLTVGNDYEYMDTQINSLATDFTYNGDYNESTTNWANARLEGVSEVLGAFLSKQ